MAAATSPMSTAPSPREEQVTWLDHRWGPVLLVEMVLVFHGWMTTRGWASERLVGNEYRQTHTAITAYFIQQDRDFSLAYPTPLLGKPWSVPY